MTGVTRPRGPLPARVYWTRRLLVTLVALALVVAVARLLGGGGGSGQPEARVVGSSPTSSVTTPSATPTATRLGPTPTPGASRSASGGVTTPLADPTGPCVGGDVLAVPAVAQPAYAANPIMITATLRTRTSVACTWTVSASSLVVKVTRPTTGSDGSRRTDSVWSTQECRGAVPKQAVVLRRDAAVAVTVVWNGRRSDSSCSTAATWAGTGYYRVAVAAFGGDPAAAGFRLGIAPRATITATPTPTPTPSPTPTRTPTGSPTPSGRVTPGAVGRPTPHATGSATVRHPGVRASASASPSRTPAAR